MKMKQKGFTLVELVITIAIVIILSVVSVPIYKGYTDKAKMSEGYALLGMILSAQKTYFSEHGNFLVDDHSSGGNAQYTCNDEVLGVDVRGNKYFTNFNVCPWTYPTSAILYSFACRAAIPTEIQSNNNGTALYLAYNITSGSTFYQAN